MPHPELSEKLFDGSGDAHNPAFLAKLAADFPYFSAGHFFLLKETPATNPEYDKIAARTAIHFNNPYYLDFQLNRRPPPEINLSEATVAEKESLNQQAQVSVSTAESFKTDLPLQISVAGHASHESPEMLFEPLHTTDYFASQGIKLSEELQQADKLGKQLRSFTDWLKTMKKVHPGKPTVAPVVLDPIVQNLAERSNKEEDVLTESMADVYLQQGKKGKAIDIFEKLSLINPAKSVYFAAKIDELKNK